MSDLTFERSQPVSLCETLDRLLSTGVVLLGGATISVAEIDLIYVGVQLVITSVHTSKTAPDELERQLGSAHQHGRQRLMLTTTARVAKIALSFQFDTILIQ